MNLLWNRQARPGNVWCIKNWTKHISNTILSLVWFLMHQTLAGATNQDVLPSKTCYQARRATVSNFTVCNFMTISALIWVCTMLGKYVCRLPNSMTTLLTHTVAHSTKRSFMLKTNNQPLKEFLSLEQKLSKIECHFGK